MGEWMEKVGRSLKTLQEVISFRIRHLRWNRRQDADFREDPDGEDHHSRGRALGYNRKCKGQDPG